MVRFRWRSLLRAAEVCAAVCALLFVGYQSILLNRQTSALAEQTANMVSQIDEMRRELQFQVNNAIRLHLKATNQQLMSMMDVAQREMNLTGLDLLAFNLLADYDAIYLMYKRQLITDKDYWQSIDQLMRHTLVTDWVRCTWATKPNSGDGKHPYFISYVHDVYAAYDQEFPGKFQEEACRRKSMGDGDPISPG